MCAYIRIYTHIYAYIRIYTHMYAWVRIRTHIYAYVDMYIYKYACVNACANVDMHLRNWYMYMRMMNPNATHTATHCNIIQHIATQYNTLQHSAAQIWVRMMMPTQHTLQRTATHCSTWQHTAAQTWVHVMMLNATHTATHCIKPQLIATRCSTNMGAHDDAKRKRHYNALQHTATHCNTLQHTAAHLWVHVIMPTTHAALRWRLTLIFRKHFASNYNPTLTL